jgi:glycosyltransferase involved in cell wall biosynthesis
MKIITLVPVKNEAWVLPYSLKNFSSFSDHVIVADQNSTDNTLEVCKNFKKVTVIKNTYQGHTNQIRWDLLDAARAIDSGNNLIIYLDADELLSPAVVRNLSDSSHKPGTAFCSPWLQLFNSYTTYRVDGVWKNNYKQFAFIDDRKLNYDHTHITNDHSNRIPELSKIIPIETPILHLQFLAKRRCEIKQAFYMCNDLLQGKNPRKINNQYSVAKFLPSITTGTIHESWRYGIEMPPFSIFESEDKIKKEELMKLFEIKGVAFFEPLDIWHIENLAETFIKKEGRIPIVKTFPKIIIKLNTIKNTLKYGILKK